MWWNQDSKCQDQDHNSNLQDQGQNQDTNSEDQDHNSNL